MIFYIRLCINKSLKIKTDNELSMSLQPKLNIAYYLWRSIDCNLKMHRGGLLH